MKKILALFLSAAILASAAACSKTGPAAKEDPSSSASEAQEAAASQEDSPETVVKNAFDALKAMDEAKINLYFADTEQLDISTLASMAGDDEAITNLATENLSYQVGKAQVAGEEATVAADITNSDMSGVFSELIPYVVQLSSQNPGMSSKETTDKTKQKLTALLKGASASTVTASVKVPLVKKDGQWQVQLDADTADALLGGLLGGMSEIMGQLTDSTPAVE